MTAPSFFLGPLDACNWFTWTTSKRRSRVTGGPIAGLLAASSMPNISDSSSVSESVLRCRVADSWRNQVKATHRRVRGISKKGGDLPEMAHDVCAQPPFLQRNFSRRVLMQNVLYCTVLLLYHLCFTWFPLIQISCQSNHHTKKSWVLAGVQNPSHPFNNFGGFGGACLLAWPEKNTTGPSVHKVVLG